MLTYDFCAATGDNKTLWREALYANGIPADFTLATSATLHMVGRRSLNVMDRAANIEPTPQVGLSVPNVLNYNFLTADCAIPDLYDATFVVTFADSSVATFPLPGTFKVLIGPALQ